MFIRTKQINGQRYAYLVENMWQGHTRQKVKKYLGKVFEFVPSREEDFPRFFNINNIEEYVAKTEFSDIIKNLTEFELIRHGFKNEDKIFINGEVIFDANVQIAYKKTKNSSKEVVIEINDGFLCNETLNNLINFKIDKEIDEKELGFRLARAFVDAGLRVPEELFVRVFEKLSAKS